MAEVCSSLPSRFNCLLPRLRAAAQSQGMEWNERVRGLARVMMVLGALMVLRFDPTEPVRPAPDMAYLLTGASLLYSLLTLAWLNLHPGPSRGTPFSQRAVAVI
jgi:hypothetical protein